MSEIKLTDLLDILKYSAKILSEKGIEDARLNAELLMAKILECSRMDLYLNFDKPLSEDEREQYKSVLKRRLKREPLQYILGETEFHNYRFTVNNKVLIPRPETELLIERTLDYILVNKLNDIRILDIGTGSGCTGMHACCSWFFSGLPVAQRKAMTAGSREKTFNRFHRENN